MGIKQKLDELVFGNSKNPYSRRRHLSLYFYTYFVGIIIATIVCTNLQLSLFFGFLAGYVFPIGVFKLLGIVGVLENYDVVLTVGYVIHMILIVSGVISKRRIVFFVFFIVVVADISGTYLLLQGAEDTFIEEIQKAFVRCIFSVDGK